MDVEQLYEELTRIVNALMETTDVVCLGEPVTGIKLVKPYTWGRDQARSVVEITTD